MTDTPTTPQPTDAYQALYDLVTTEYPMGKTKIAEAVATCTDFDRVCDAMIVESLVAISFGAVYAAGKYADLITQAAALYSDRLMGFPPTKTAWSKTRRACAREIKAFKSVQLSSEEMTVYAAHEAARDSAASPSRTLWRAMNVWDMRVPTQHPAFAFWAAERLYHYTSTEEKIHHGYKASRTTFDA